MQITSSEMGQRVGEFDDFGDFDYIKSGGRAERYVFSSLHLQRWANVLANLTIWAISVTSRVEAEQKDIYFLRYISRDGLTCWRI